MQGPDSVLELGSEREKFFSLSLEGVRDDFHLEHTRLADEYFQSRLAEIFPGITPVGRAWGSPFALVAVGGYGREELCPESDLDVLLVFKGRIPRQAEELARAVFFPLWDQGLDLGHGVRSIGDCVNLAKSDNQVFASLLDARFLAGDRDVFHRLEKKFRKLNSGRQAMSFIRWLEGLNLRREGEFGDSTSLLEPDLKNGLGGLRDRHQIGWLAILLGFGQRLCGLSGPEGLPPFSDSEWAELERAFGFVLATRCALHLVAGRRTDRLHFDFQPRVAELMGFEGGATPMRKGLAVERFLSRLHRSMSLIKAMREAFVREHFSVERRSGVRSVEDGDSAWALFEKTAETGEAPDWEALRSIRTGLEKGDIDPAGPDALERMLRIFRTPHGHEAAKAMMDTGFLGTLIPEFEKVAHLVQFDDYHLRPVGMHTLETVRKVAGFLAGRDNDDRYAEIASELDDPKALLFAAFFHDLGKGRGDHSRVGGEIARNVLGRLKGIGEDVLEDTVFLVERHLLIPRTATRSDLSDESVIVDLAGKVGTVRRLDMLYLLSVADSMATGPRAWSGWVSALLAEAYFKCRKLMTLGPMSEPSAAMRILGARDKVRRLASGRLDPDFVEACLGMLPPSVPLRLEPERILEHFEIRLELEEAQGRDMVRKPSSSAGLGLALVRPRETGVQGCRELTIAARDRPGLFATLAGVLALHGLDILSAEVFTWKDGTALDVFMVGGMPDNIHEKEVWTRVRRGILCALTGKLALELRLAEQKKSPLSSVGTGPVMDPTVSVDNDSSDFHTLVEVVAGDRIGLLYDMATAMHYLDVVVHMAKITTSGGRVSDLFYVREADGRKVEDPERVAELEKTLLDAVLEG